MLDFRITDRVGVGLARLVNFSGGQVESPLSGPDMAEVTISMKSPAAAFLNDNLLKYMLKCIWNQNLIFWGPLVGGHKQYASGTIQLQAHDPTWWWKFQNHRYGDEVVATDNDPHAFPVNGNGLRRLANSALITDAQATRGVKHPGIWLPGHDDTPTEDATPSNLDDGTQNPDASGVLWLKGVERGTVVYDTVQDITSIMAVPMDYGLTYIDPEHLTTEVTSYPAGYFAQLDTWAHRGTDLTTTDGAPAFHYGWGADNLADFDEDPDPSKTINYAVVTEQSGQNGGADGTADTTATGAVHNEASWLEIGIMENWSTGGPHDKTPQLTARSKALVGAYGEPPKNFSFKPKTDRIDRPLWRRDFGLGDVIEGVAKRDNSITDVLGRIVKVTVNQTDKAGNSACTVECVPHIEVTFGDGDNA